MKYLILILLLLICLLTIIIIWLLKERRSYQDTLTSVLEHLDMAIAGAEQDAAYDENIDSAITEKLNQLVDISRMSVENAGHDKNLVQSLISDIAHQVRTPLTNIMLYTGILKESAITGESEKAAAQIQRQSEKLDFFMRELVRSSYLETEMISVYMETSEIDELIAQSVQAVEMAALKKKILFDIVESGKSACFDFRWTREALVNVLDNAIKYSPEGSTITIRTLSYESFVCIQTADEGIGIDEGEQGAVFKRFYRCAGAEKEQGLGIGLYLVKEIIGKQNGYVKVNSALKKGTVFSIYLSKVSHLRKI